MDVKDQTPFSTIYDSFLNRITDSMYMEMTEEDTKKMLQPILLNALPRFKFPRFDIFDYDFSTRLVVGEQNPLDLKRESGFFNAKLTPEEINILSLAMVVEWLGQQLAITENTKMKYSGVDFKLTSQANHMAKLKLLIDKYEEECKSLQDIYRRRKRVNGEIRSTFGQIMETPKYGLNIDE